jgi:hypothetical protein
VAGILLIAFVVIHTAPGDPVLALAGEHGDAAYYAFIRAKFGLDFESRSDGLQLPSEHASAQCCRVRGAGAGERWYDDRGWGIHTRELLGQPRV